MGGRKLSHIEDNIEGLAVTLSEDEIALTEDAYKFDAGFPQGFLSGTIGDGSDAPQKMASRASEVR